MTSIEKDIMLEVKETMLEETDLVYMEGLRFARTLTVGSLFQLLHAPPNSLTGSIYRKKKSYASANEVKKDILSGELSDDYIILCDVLFGTPDNNGTKYTVNTANRYKGAYDFGLDFASMGLLPNDEYDLNKQSGVSEYVFDTFPVYSVEKVSDDIINTIRNNVNYTAFERFMEHFNWRDNFHLVIPYHKGAQMLYVVKETNYANIILDLLDLYTEGSYPYNFTILPSSMNLVSRPITLEELKNNLSRKMVENDRKYLIKYNRIDNKTLRYVEGSSSVEVRNAFSFVSEEMQNSELADNFGRTLVISEMKPIDHSNMIVLTKSEFYTALNTICLHAPLSLTELNRLL